MKPMTDAPMEENVVSTVLKIFRARQLLAESTTLSNPPASLVIVAEKGSDRLKAGAWNASQGAIFDPRRQL